MAPYWHNHFTQECDEFNCNLLHFLFRGLLQLMIIFLCIVCPTNAHRHTHTHTHTLSPTDQSFCSHCQFGKKGRNQFWNPPTRIGRKKENKSNVLSTLNKTPKCDFQANQSQTNFSCFSPVMKFLYVRISGKKKEIPRQGFSYRLIKLFSSG